MSCDRIDLGKADLGNLVGIGRPHDVDARAALSLCRFRRVDDGRRKQAAGWALSRGAAIYALVGAINIPIINRSVVWWNSLHQGPSITMRGSSIDGGLLWPLGLTLAGFSLLFGAIMY